MVGRRDFLTRCLSVPLALGSPGLVTHGACERRLVALMGAPAFFGPYMTERLVPGVELATRRVNGVVEVSLDDRTLGLIPDADLPPGAALVLHAADTSSAGRLSITCRLQQAPASPGPSSP